MPAKRKRLRNTCIAVKGPLVFLCAEKAAKLHQQVLPTAAREALAPRQQICNHAIMTSIRMWCLLLSVSIITEHVVGATCIVLPFIVSF